MDRDRANHYPLRRRTVVAALLQDRGETLVVTGLGAATWDATAAGDHDLTFPFWGAMGGTAMAGLGLSLAQPERRVLVITGDGDMLMGLGAIAAIAAEQPANLAVVVIDNERYGETGMQVTATAGSVDLAAMAAAAGWPATGRIDDEAGLEAALPLIRDGAGPMLYDVKVRAEELPLVMPPKDGAHLKDRFRRALLGDV
ncbi:MAG: thiamine pyrophosphate-dependent enzyme [Alphaproteobacteria bacterium]|jgi:thiamine pyrophosphate-dependent acetolactate synthase large subunit-like protein|nr:thiamine pyrophosphate-dependent enzyme [Alphaproteobacteria bacterium]